MGQLFLASNSHNFMIHCGNIAAVEQRKEGAKIHYSHTKTVTNLSSAEYDMLALELEVYRKEFWVVEIDGLCLWLHKKYANNLYLWGGSYIIVFTNKDGIKLGELKISEAQYHWFRNKRMIIESDRRVKMEEEKARKKAAKEAKKKLKEAEESKKLTEV